MPSLLGKKFNAPVGTSIEDHSISQMQLWKYWRRFFYSTTNGTVLHCRYASTILHDFSNDAQIVSMVANARDWQSSRSRHLIRCQLCSDSYDEQYVGQMMLEERSRTDFCRRWIQERSKKPRRKDSKASWALDGSGRLKGWEGRACSVHDRIGVRVRGHIGMEMEVYHKRTPLFWNFPTSSNTSYLWWRISGLTSFDGYGSSEAHGQHVVLSCQCDRTCLHRWF